MYTPRAAGAACRALSLSRSARQAAPVNLLSKGSTCAVDRLGRGLLVAQTTSAGAQSASAASPETYKAVRFGSVQQQ